MIEVSVLKYIAAFSLIVMNIGAWSAVYGAAMSDAFEEPLESGRAAADSGPQLVFESVASVHARTERNISVPKKRTAETRNVETFETGDAVRTVPFYSQFTDISDPAWKKLGCGIASLAMVIEYYEDVGIDVDALLADGIEAGAYLENAGWIHSGLVGLAATYDLSGGSRGLSHLSIDAAFARLTEALEDGPVIASVYYTFTPGHPIPHLVVVNDVVGDTVYYNDPAEPGGGGSISIEKFKPAWKKRFIEIRPQS